MCIGIIYFEYFEFVDHLNFISQKNCKISFCGHFHPEGIAFTTNDEFVQKGFKTIKLPSLPVAIICPAIVEGRNRNGFLIFDSKERILSAKKI